MNPLVFLDHVGEWLADLVAARINDVFHQSLEKLERKMSATTDALGTLTTSVNAMHDDVATTVSTLGSLKTQIDTLTQQINSGADDPAVLATVQQIQATVDDAKTQLEGALNPAPATPPATPPTDTGTPPAQGARR